MTETFGDDRLNDKIEAYYAARTDYDFRKQQSDEADKLRRIKEAELVDYMLNNGIQKVSLNDGTTPLLVNGVSISVTKDNFAEIREWLTETVGDDADYIETVVSKPAVLEHIKKKIEEGYDPLEFPAFLRCDARPTLRVNGWKTRN